MSGPQPADAPKAERLLAGGRQNVTAESCTGGWLAKVCTDRPGSSRWFRGGVVAYTNDLNTALLGVWPATLEEAGPLSEATVREMAVGALERLGGDVAVAVTGIAGPDGGSIEKPVGTVWFGWAYRSAAGIDVRTRRHCFDGTREEVRVGPLRRR